MKPTLLAIVALVVVASALPAAPNATACEISPEDPDCNGDPGAEPQPGCVQWEPLPPPPDEECLP